jgi:hypothetical protein
MQEADEYSRAYSKALAKKVPRKKREFFGDVDFWRNPKREWTEDFLPQGRGPNRGIDPMMRSLRQPIPNRWIGGY